MPVDLLIYNSIICNKTVRFSFATYILMYCIAVQEFPKDNIQLRNDSSSSDIPRHSDANAKRCLLPLAVGGDTLACLTMT